MEFYSLRAIEVSWPLVSAAVFFVLVFIHQTGGALRERLPGFIAGGLVLFFTVRAILLAYIQYQVWEAGETSRLLLPPHQPLGYFFRYSFTHFFAGAALTVISAVFVVSFFRWFFRRRPALFLQGDLGFIGAGCLLVRWPLVIPYVGLSLVSAFLWGAARRYIMKEEGKILLSPFFLLWLPGMLIFGEQFISFFGIEVLVMPL